MVSLLFLLILLLGLWVLSLRGRTGHPGLDLLSRYHYAHRGLYGPGIPENSLAAFRRAKGQGYGIELDLHLLKDGELAVIHDSLLARTTGRSGTVEELTAPEAAQCRLEGSEEPLPLFSQVLELLEGHVPLILELKPRGSNYPQLCEKACEMMEGYPGPYCLESFDPRCVLWLRKNRPALIRGQLWENFLAPHPWEQPFPLRLAAWLQLENFLTRPDFIACRYSDRRNPGVFLCRKLWRIRGVTWTVRTPEELKTAKKEKWVSIFEGFEPG